jgi:hypothetical protein
MVAVEVPNGRGVRLREIMASPAFETLPPKEQKYMKRIYDEGNVSGSYRLRRVQEVYNKIAKP